MSWFPVHSDGQCTISLWFHNGVQEGDGPILLIVLHHDIYGRVNTVNVLKEALFVDLLVDEKGIIHIPAPKPRGGGSTLSFLFQVLHVEVGNNGADWGTHSSTLNLFIELVLERKVGVLETKLPIGE